MHDLSFSILELMDFLPGVVFSIEAAKDHKLQFISDSISGLLGYEREQFMADPAFWLRLIHPDDRDEVLKGLEIILTKKYLIQEYRFLNREEHSLWVRAEMKLITDAGGNALGIVGLWTDVNERRLIQERAEQELRASEERFTKAFQLSPVLMAITSLKDGTYLEVNHAFLSTLGYKKEQVLGHRNEELNILIYPRSRKKFLEEVSRQGSIHNYEVSYQDSHGKVHTGLYFAEAVVIDETECLLSVILDITKRKKTEEQIRYQAYHDLLTGLPNRRLFEERLRYIIADARRQQEKVAVLFLDLDGFKRVNDTMGHDEGDKVLRDIAANLKRCLREADTVARLGGDEFMIILPHLQTPKDAMPAIERILNVCRKTYGDEKIQISISISMGAAIFPDNGTNVTTLMKNADIAMYQAKDQGRDRAVFYQEKTEQL